MTTMREKYNQEQKEERRREILAAYPLPRAMWELAEASQRAQIEHLWREIERIEKQTPIDVFLSAACRMPDAVVQRFGEDVKQAWIAAEPSEYRGAWKIIARSEGEDLREWYEPHAKVVAYLTGATYFGECEYGAYGSYYGVGCFQWTGCYNRFSRLICTSVLCIPPVQISDDALLGGYSIDLSQGKCVPTSTETCHQRQGVSQGCAATGGTPDCRGS